MIKLAICDDDPTFLERVRRLTENYLSDFGVFFTIDMFSHGNSLCSKIQNGHVYDIMLLEIEMSDVNGVDVGKRLREKLRCEKTILIYLSVHEHRAKELFHLDVHRFLSKPIDRLLFREALQSAVVKIPDEKEKKFSFKDCSRGPTQLNISDILYFEVIHNHRIDIVTAKQGYCFYGKLVDVQLEMEKEGFLRIHQSYLINCSHIETIAYKEVTIKNQITLPISGPRRKQIRKEFMQIKKLYRIA